MHDLSIVTDALRKVINDALANSPLWSGPPPFSVNVSGQHPETPTGGSDVELSLYMFHIAPDKFLANSFWSQAAQSGGGTGKQPVAFEPLALDLWFMLSAQSQTSYVQEQQTLSVAMQALHERGTIKLPTPTPLPNPVVPSEATVILESPTFDELSRLWQALGLALRTTAQYRVSVLFLTPDTLPPEKPKVTSYTLTAAPANAAPDPSLPLLLSTRRTVEYVAPGPLPAAVDRSPATTAPAPGGVSGQEVVLDAVMLADTDHVQLVSYSASGVATETDITAAWKVPLVPPYASPPARGVPFVLRPPAGAGAPAPGRYEIFVTRPTEPGWESNRVPIDVAAWIDPAGGPSLNAAGGLYTLGVRNVPASGAALRLGTAQLERIADGGAPAAGQWQHNSNVVTFRAPAGLAAGTYQIALRAADVDADPALWAVVP